MAKFAKLFYNRIFARFALSIIAKKHRKNERDTTKSGFACFVLLKYIAEEKKTLSVVKYIKQAVFVIRLFAPNVSIKPKIMLREPLAVNGRKQTNSHNSGAMPTKFNIGERTFISIDVAPLICIREIKSIMLVIYGNKSKASKAPFLAPTQKIE